MKISQDLDGFKEKSIRNIKILHEKLESLIKFIEFFIKSIQIFSMGVFSLLWREVS